ncbi:hypothetical protein BJ508DRAFT_359207 [Ascobolus immersus RN42]|uniref:Glutathione S-transferase n=1 Tax=Ascobolus immersus RN42 TaxID=1160509 RepID=A0A3N4IHL1_ASCIM|nr:hypothetical protein BJ508DRAFT_359207 [Ascobolus immersus RN42]
MSTPAPITLYSGATFTTPRVLMTLLEGSIPHNIISIDLAAGDQRNPAYKAKVSFSGQVPALIDTSVTPTLKLTESTTIAFYLADKYAPHLSFPYGTNEYYQLLSVLDFITDLHIMCGVTKFIFSKEMNPMYGKNETIDPHFGKRTLTRCAGLNSRLVEAREAYGTDEPWMMGNKFTVADISAYAVFRHLREEAPYYNDGVAELKEIVAWIERMEARECTKQAYEMFKGFAEGRFEREFKME